MYLLRKIRHALLGSIVTLLGSFCLAIQAHAHEVYVLSPEAIKHSLETPSFSLWDVLIQNLDRFMFWAFIAVLTVVGVFFISVSRSIERIFDPFLAKLPLYAPVVSRITIGIAFVAAAYYHALYGPELPLDSIFGSAGASVAIATLVIVGLMIMVGFYARIAAFVALVMFGMAVTVYGSYMFTYMNYAGELLLLLILGAHKWSYHHKEHDEARISPLLLSFKKQLMPFAFPILRVAFGVSLVYASLYAKVIHNQLAISVAATPFAEHTTSLASVFGFSPEFLVLGAAIVEILIGLFFILGIEIRFTSIFLMFWLGLSLWYFGEIVWPHIILIGIPVSFIFYGYDKYSLEGYIFKRNGREPVL